MVTRHFRRRSAAVLAAVGIPVGLLIWVYWSAHGRFQEVGEILRSGGGKALLYSLGIGILASVVASGVFYLWIGETREAFMRRMERLGPPGLTDTFLEDLGSLHGIHGNNYTASVQLSSHDIREFLKCQIRYSYVVFMDQSKVKFRLELTTSFEYSPYPDDTYAEFHFFKRLDESSITSPLEAEHYTVRSLRIDNHFIEAPKRRTGTTDSPTRGRFVEYEARVPRECINRAVQFEFVVEFPMERESVIQMLLPWPSKGATLELDASGVIDEIDVSAQPSFSLGAVPRAIPSIDGRLEFPVDGWVLPQNGVTFVWWRRRQRAPDDDLTPEGSTDIPASPRSASRVADKPRSRSKKPPHPRGTDSLPPRNKGKATPGGRGSG